MRRRELIEALGAAALAGVGSQTQAQTAAPNAMPKVGAPLPLADIPLFDGTTFRASSAQGQVLVVYWWASWCPFCAIQTPLMQKLWDAQRPRGLKMLGLSIDQKAEAARQYMSTRGYTFPSGHVGTQAGTVLARPGKGLPVTVVRGRDGRLVMAEPGQLFPEDIEQIASFL